MDPNLTINFDKPILEDSVNKQKYFQGAAICRKRFYILKPQIILSEKICLFYYSFV